MEYSIARKIVYKRLIAHIEIKEYNNLEDESNICFSFRKKSFSNYKEFPLLHTFLIFGKLGYIDIDVDTSYGYYDY